MTLPDYTAPISRRESGSQVVPTFAARDVMLERKSVDGSGSLRFPRLYRPALYPSRRPQAPGHPLSEGRAVPFLVTLAFTLKFKCHESSNKTSPDPQPICSRASGRSAVPWRFRDNVPGSARGSAGDAGDNRGDGFPASAGTGMWTGAR